VNAAVIGGVVAVAVFVLIVTIIVLVRYFMAHKGELRLTDNDFAWLLPCAGLYRSLIHFENRNCVLIMGVGF